VRQIRKQGGTAIAIQTDIKQWKAIQALFDFAESELGGVDLAVLNAGVSLDHNTVEDSDMAAWEETLHTNLLGTYYCAKAAIPTMKKQGGGKIVTIGSGMGHKGSVGVRHIAVQRRGCGCSPAFSRSNSGNTT
tara:strand:- start:680 stop:1078 length:399 start_codon:yes stop_codon:yes gene_type:complete